MSDEQLLLFRKILNIGNYSESTILSYNNSLIQFIKWNCNEQPLSKELLFNYVEYLIVSDRSYSYIKSAIMAFKLFSELVHRKAIKNDFLKGIKRKSTLPDVLGIEEVKRVLDSIDKILCTRLLFL